jgi:hypothetical protein
MLTNDEVIAVNQRSTGNRPLWNRDQLIAWAADVPGSGDRYLALFNARDRVRLTPPHARYRSAPVTRDPAGAVPIDVALAGAHKLILFVDPTSDGVAGDAALWIEPTLVFEDGRTQPLVDPAWTSADALWDSAAVRRSTMPRPLTFRSRPISFAIATLAASRIEYPLPPGVARFRATGAIDDRTKAATGGGSVRFVVAPATPQTENTAPGVPIRVSLPELGFPGPVRVRDLWTHREIGTFRDEFAPELPFHGAGLYRLSAAR